MRPSKFTQNQIMQALRQVNDGTPAVQVCRKLGITQTTFYRWRAKYGSASVNGSRELWELREENQKLRQIVTNLMLGKQPSLEARARK